MTHAPSDDRSLPRWLPAALLICLVLAVFGQTIRFGWVNLDDEVNVTKNPGLHPVTIASLWRFWRAPYEGLYIPMSYTLFAGEVEASRLIFGRPSGGPLSPGPFHGVSVALHTINVLLVWWLLVRVTRGGRWPAAVGAALFAIHPLQVESVAWISEQRGLASASFSLAAIMLHVTGGQTARRPAERLAWAAAATACFGLALLSKPQAAAVPLIAAMLDMRLFRRPARIAVLSLLGWFLLAAAAAVVTRGLYPVHEDILVPVWQRPLIAGDALAFYVSKLVLPLGLCIDYGRTPRFVLAHPAACASAIAALIGLAGIMCLPPLRRWRLPAAVFIVALAPVLGLVPFLFQGFSTVADRYAYLALLGPAIALASAAEAWMASPARRLPLAVGCLGLAMLAGLSIRQAGHWRDSIALNEHALRVNPDSFLGACNLGSALTDAALVDADMLPSALPWLERAVTARPGHVSANLGMGMVLDKLGRLDEAIPYYEAVLALRPMHAEANNYLGVIRARQGRVDLAAEHFQQAVDAQPGYHDAAKNLDRARRILDAQPPK
jgi:tetratricopeptide (TPR) repeat protein